MPIIVINIINPKQVKQVWIYINVFLIHLAQEILAWGKWPNVMLQIIYLLQIVNDYR